MPLLPIYVDGTKPLRQKAKPVNEKDESIIKLIIDMFDTMKGADGIGLAANQVGVLKRVIVIDVSGLEETKNIKPFALINPEVIFKEGKCVMEEGCLSVPEIRAEIQRAKKIVVKYKDTDFKDNEIEAEDLLARVILHELDHLNGVLFIDHLPESQQKEFGEKLEMIQNGEIETKYPIMTFQKVNHQLT